MQNFKHFNISLHVQEKLDLSCYCSGSI